MSLQVILVEGEPILRQGIKTIIAWQTLGCDIVGDFSNPIEALDFMKHETVDLIISDIQMPKMDGLCFAKEVAACYPHVKFIFLTAFSSFSYAQNALQLGVVDYVLKADFVNDLPNAVKNFQEKYQQDLQQHNKQQEKLFLQALQRGQSVNTPLFKAWLERQGLEVQSFYVILAEIDIAGYQQFEGGQQALHTSVQNFIDMSFQEMQHISMLLSEQMIFTIVSFDTPEHDKHLLRVLHVCNQIIKTVQSYMNFEINLVISDMHSTLASMHLAYQEAVDMLQNVYNSSCVQPYIQTTEKNIGLLSVQMHKHLEEILFGIKKQDVALLQKTLDTFFTECKTQQIPYGYLRFQIINAIANIMTRLQKNCINFSVLLTIQEDFLQKTNQECSMFLLQKHCLLALQAIATQYCETAEEYSPMIAAAQKYIQQNYKSHITLDAIAQHCNISANYLSTQYKKETGQSIISYISQFKVEKAKEMLLQNYMVSEVAYALGYQDPAYFSNVFSKHTGKSPKQYAQSRE